MMNVEKLQTRSTPYTYILEWTKQGKRYIGARWAVGCHPSDLWNSYFTSSAYVADFVKIHGAPDIILIDKTFGNAIDAMTREKELQQQFDIIKNPNFLNKGIFGSYDLNDPEIRERNRLARIGIRKSEETKKKISLAKKGKPSPNKGKAMSAAQKEKLRIAHTGKKASPEMRSWFSDFHRTRIRSKETGRRISAAKMGHYVSKETRKKISESNTGRISPRKGVKLPQEQIEKMRLVHLGTKRSDETKRRMSIASSGKKQDIVECPHCNKKGGKATMPRWHFDNCKLKGE